MKFKTNNIIKYNNIHTYSYILNKSTLINLINEDKQFEYCEKNLFKSNKFFKLLILFSVISIKFIKKNFNNIYRYVTKSNKNDGFMSELIFFIKKNILNKFEFIYNLKSKLFSMFEKKLIFYTIAKFTELVIYSLLIKIMANILIRIITIQKYLEKILSLDISTN